MFGLIVLFLIEPSTSLSGATGSPEVVERRVYLMGTQASLIASRSSRAAAVEGLTLMLEVLESAEEELSTWRESSLLSRLNRQPVGQVLHAAPIVCELLTDLQGWTKLTGGAFDPALGLLTKVWDVNTATQIPSAAVVQGTLTRVGLEHFSVDLRPCRITRRIDAILDSGAFGKGAALDRLIALGEPGLVDLGGQIAVVGVSPDGGWPVAVAHPQHRTREVLGLNLISGSLAVSGGSERDKWVDGKQVGHILDPRTGKPVNRNISVAVWHNQALAADVLATALYVMGVEEGFEWAEEHEISACFLVPTRPTTPNSVSSVTFIATKSFRSRFLDSCNFDISEAVSRCNKGVDEVKENERRIR